MIPWLKIWSLLFSRITWMNQVWETRWYWIKLRMRLGLILPCTVHVVSALLSQLLRNLSAVNLQIHQWKDQALQISNQKIKLVKPCLQDVSMMCHHRNDTESWNPWNYFEECLEYGEKWSRGPVTFQQVVIAACFLAFIWTNYDFRSNFGFYFRSFRYAAYRNLYFFLFKTDNRKKGSRMVLPSCLVEKVRLKYPGEESGMGYVGFVDK